MLPQDCQLCGAASTASICDSCADDLPYHLAAGCVCCGQVADMQSLEGEICGHCLADPPKFDTTQTAFFYAFPLDKLIPMPLARQRLATRGFNQSALLAREIGGRLNINVESHGLLRVRDTPPQAGLDRVARLENMKGAFACGQNLAGLKIALVDDVMTTGATMSDAARALKKQGAARIDAWAIARASK
jgi:predicted amidophosphoribosyltransferase